VGLLKIDRSFVANLGRDPEDDSSGGEVILS
jgi:EAL domain-containing protein (putative c-di-GMP-specific phosphodiesterase class I)